MCELHGWTYFFPYKYLINIDLRLKIFCWKSVRTALESMPGVWKDMFYRTNKKRTFVNSLHKDWNVGPFHIQLLCHWRQLLRSILCLSAMSCQMKLLTAFMFHRAGFVRMPCLFNWNWLRLSSPSNRFVSVVGSVSDDCRFDGSECESHPGHTILVEIDHEICSTGIIGHFPNKPNFYYQRVSIIEPPHDKTNKIVCAPSDDSDQPGHPHSLIRVFAVRMKKAWDLERRAKTLIRLGGCPGLSESSLGAQIILFVLLRGGSVYPFHQWRSPSNAIWDHFNNVQTALTNIPHWIHYYIVGMMRYSSKNNNILTMDFNGYQC